MDDLGGSSRFNQLIQDSKKAKTRCDRITILSKAFNIDPENVLIFEGLAFSLGENESIELGTETWFREDVVKEWNRLKIERKIHEEKSITPRTQALGKNYYNAKSSGISWHTAHLLPLHVSKLSHHVDGNPTVQRFREKLIDKMTESSWHDFYDEVSSFKEKDSNPNCFVEHLKHVYMAISLMFMDTKTSEADRLTDRVKFEASKTGSDYPYLIDAERELATYLKLSYDQDDFDGLGIQLDQVYFFAAACLLRRQGRLGDAALLFEDFETWPNIFYNAMPYQSLKSIEKSNFEFEKYVIREQKKTKVSPVPVPPPEPRKSILNFSSRTRGLQFHRGAQPIEPMLASRLSVIVPEIIAILQAQCLLSNCGNRKSDTCRKMCGKSLCRWTRLWASWVSK